MEHKQNTFDSPFRKNDEKEKDKKKTRKAIAKLFTLYQNVIKAVYSLPTGLLKKVQSMIFQITVSLSAISFLRFFISMYQFEKNTNISQNKLEMSYLWVITCVPIRLRVFVYLFLLCQIRVLEWIYTP